MLKDDVKLSTDDLSIALKKQPGIICASCNGLIGVIEDNKARLFKNQNSIYTCPECTRPWLVTTVHGHSIKTDNGGLLPC